MFDWFKKQTPLAKATIVGGIALIFLLGVAVGSLSNQEKKEASQEAQESIYEEPIVTTSSDTTPPELTITQPADNSVVITNQITVSGKTEVGVTLRVDWREQSVQSDGSFNFLYTLNSGQNVLIFTATDEAGNTTRKQLSLTYNPPPPLTAQQSSETVESFTSSEETVGYSSSEVPEPQEEYPYTASRLREPFHYTWCYWAQQIHDENRQWFSTRDEAIAAGHRPCKICNP